MVWAARTPLYVLTMTHVHHTASCFFAIHIPAASPSQNSPPELQDLSHHFSADVSHDSSSLLQTDCCFDTCISCVFLVTWHFLCFSVAITGWLLFDFSCWWTRCSFLEVNPRKVCRFIPLLPYRSLPKTPICPLSWAQLSDTVIHHHRPNFTDYNGASSHFWCSKAKTQIKVGKLRRPSSYVSWITSFDLSIC